MAVTINSTLPRIEYTASAGQTAFPYPFPIFADSDLEVYKATSDPGPSDILTLTTDYTVSGAGTSGGGTVTLTSGASLNDIVVIRSAIPQDRTTNFLDNAPFEADEINTQLNELTQMVKQLDSKKVNRYAEDTPEVDAPLIVPNATLSTHAINKGQLDAHAFTAVTSNTPVVGSIAALKALSTASFTECFVTGYVSEGDGGGGHYYYDASDTTSSDNGGTVIVADDTTSRWKLVHFGFVTQKQFGAVGDDATNDTTAIHAWLNNHMSEGWEARGVDGNYLMDTYSITTMTRSFNIKCSRDCVFKYRTAESDPLFSITHTTAGVYGLTWIGGTIDNSGGTFVNSTNSNTCLELERLINYEIASVYFKGEATYDDANTVTTGTDSALTTVNCSRGRIHDNIIEGQGDAGIYLSGGSLTASSDDGGETVIYGNHFLQCWQGITTKRDVDRNIIYGNFFTDCRTGVIAVEADSVDPGLVHQIYGNNFKRIETRAVEVRANNGHQIFGNIVEDFGFQSDGTSISGTPYAFMITGSQKCDFHSNRVYQKDWIGNPVTGLHGLYINSATINSVLYTPSENRVRNNNFANVQFGITEATSGQNRYSDNEFESTVTTHYNSLDSNNQVKYIDTGDSYLALTNVGNVGAGEDDLQTLTIPADTFKASQPNRIIKVRAWGFTANNANAKTLKFYVGSTQIDSVTLTTSQASDWAFDVVITGASSQNIYSEFTQDGATAIHQIARSNPSETITAGIIVKCTGEGVSDNDIVSDGMTLEIVR